MKPIKLNAVLFEAEGVLLRAVVDQLQADIEDGFQPFEGFRPAPARVWALFERAQRDQVGIEERSAELPVEARLFQVAA
jgi:hypothetical protein